jgi:hypothetical protein
METSAPSVRFTIKKGDLFRLQLRAVLSNRIIWGLYLISLCIFVNGLLSAPGFQERSVVFRVFFGFFGAVLFTVPFCLLQLLVVANAVFWKKHQGLIGEHTITLTPEGLEESTSFNSGLHRWTGILRVVSTRLYLLIYINEYMVHTIPKRAFSSVTDAENFEQCIRQAMAESKSAPTSSQ